jgi:hypothetical protein
MPAARKVSRFRDATTRRVLFVSLSRRVVAAPTLQWKMLTLSPPRPAALERRVFSQFPDARTSAMVLAQESQLRGVTMPPARWAPSLAPREAPAVMPCQAMTTFSPCRPAALEFSALLDVRTFVMALPLATLLAPREAPAVVSSQTMLTFSPARLAALESQEFSPPHHVRTSVMMRRPSRTSSWCPDVTTLALSLPVLLAVSRPRFAALEVPRPSSPWRPAEPTPRRRSALSP